MNTSYQPAYRDYVKAVSAPNYAAGSCPSCNAFVEVGAFLPYNDPTAPECSNCGTQTTRHRLILNSLATISTVTWSLFASDFQVYERFEIPTASPALYNVTDNVSKWLHSEAHVLGEFSKRFTPNFNFSNPLLIVSVVDTLWYDKTQEPPPESVPLQWSIFGQRTQQSVPAWRQSLFAAANLANTNPAASLVLIAAGFEAYFTESMRISWRARNLSPAAFERLNGRNTAISNLVRWLPEAVGRPGLTEAPDNLLKNWEELVNGRRNAVVHRANVNFEYGQVLESLRTALECIVYLDPHALLRPHAYYTAD